MRIKRKETDAPNKIAMPLLCCKEIYSLIHSDPGLIRCLAVTPNQANASPTPHVVSCQSVSDVLNFAFLEHCLLASSSYMIIALWRLILHNMTTGHSSNDQY